MRRADAPLLKAPFRKPLPRREAVPPKAVPPKAVPPEERPRNAAGRSVRAPGTLFAVAEATAGRTPARSQFLPGPCGVRRAVRAGRPAAKFRFALPAPAARSAAPDEAAEPVAPIGPRPPRDSRSAGTVRGRDGLRWSAPVPASRSRGTRRGMTGAR